MKKVSVIIPSYKRADYICRAIDSVLSQDYANLELVVVDDNGLDSPYHAQTEKKIEKYKGPNFIYLCNPVNRGGCHARNAGIEASTGDYLTFLDDDDIYLPGKISLQAGLMEKNGWDLSFMDVEIADQNTGEILDRRRHALEAENSSEKLMVTHLMDPLTPTATYMYSREALFRVGGFDDVASGQEYMLMHKSINAALKIGYIPEARVRQYLHDGERISYGSGRVASEKRMLTVKRQFFFLLSPAQRREVECRHYCAMFFACFKRHEYAGALIYGLRAAVVSPRTGARIFLGKRRMMRAKAVKT